MKFTFYIDSKKKKQQVIKAKTSKELITVAKIAKCELTKNSILKDLDFSSNGKLMCIVKDKALTMKELWAYLEPKLQNDNNIEKKDKPEKKKKENKKDKKKKSLIAGEKKKSPKNKKEKKNKKKSSKKKDSKQNIQPKNDITKTSDGLIHITRR